ncbi:hypothetical protein NNX28_10660 [Arthrobacter sp. zg-Y859]|uniref:Uncharacterized protein n=1 Tax=Arthrobacter jinronghuae TaxID=2964609 RepID=A0ABT1NRN9_9MICC|nr:hypothetical protein [Arthrobacter jinronghuae]MCQ1950393.1 hypothetical protein [Arthrobacter jinronghuae]UWX77368.1 hypothetical protein N2K98_10150 [Arthrobacter jinronghuae]
MKTTMTRTAVLLSTAGLIAGSAVFAAPASASVTECEPGSTATTFTGSTTSRETAGTATLTNSSTVTAPVALTSERSVTSQASTKGPVPLSAILPAARTEISPLAFETASWRAGQSVFQLTLPAGQSHDVTYGFNLMSFSGSQQECGLDGRFGPATDFSGTVPTGTYVDF